MEKLPKFIALENIIKARSFEFNCFIKTFKERVKNQNNLKNRKRSFRVYDNSSKKKYLGSYLKRKTRRKKILLKRIESRLYKNPKLLSSHVWHAKRFQMLNQWGWQIPYSRNSSKKLTIKKMSQRHLIQDLSFFTIIKISGTKILLDSFLLDWLMPFSIKITNNFYLLFKETTKSHVLSPMYLIPSCKSSFFCIIHPKGTRKIIKQINKIVTEFKVRMVIETGRHGLFQLIGSKTEFLVRTALNSLFFFIPKGRVEKLTIKNSRVIMYKIRKRINYEGVKHEAWLIFLLNCEEYMNLWIKLQFCKVEAIGWNDKRNITKQLNLIYINFEQSQSWTINGLKRNNFNRSMISAFVSITSGGYPNKGAKIYSKHAEEEIGFITQRRFCTVCSKTIAFGFVQKLFSYFSNIYVINSVRDDQLKKAILVTKSS